MIRKIIKVGNSDGVTIPVRTMRVLKLKAGDRVEVFVGKPGSGVNHLELLEEFEKFNMQYGQAMKNLAKR